jgi:dihydroxyacid dehydratase/phosphogluconate dehydratase
MMLAAFGVVPRKLDVTLRTPSDEQLSEAVKRLITGIQKRERRVSVASLVRSNLGNAASVWSATGGHPSWILHLTYLADALGKKMTSPDVTRRARSVPQILGFGDTSGNSVYAMATETENGGNSGIDTIMRTLSEKRLIDDRAPTLDGSWMQRIMEARSANGSFLHSTMTPFSASCGVSVVQGNICSGGIACVGSRNRDAIAPFDKRIYLAVYYLGLGDLHADLVSPGGIMERLRNRVTREDLYYTWSLNWQSATSNGTGAELAHRNKARLWDYLVTEKLLRIMVVVAGVGPHAAGMPEIQVLNASSSNLESLGVLVTDGRVLPSNRSISVGHVVPEAFDGGMIGSIRTGDWVYLDLTKGELNVLRPLARFNGFKTLSAKELRNRPDLKRRIQEIRKLRTDLVPSVRILLDQLSSAEFGVSPLNK